MVFQNCSIASGGVNPINMGHGSTLPMSMAMSSKKRKASDSDESDYDQSSFHSNKLCLPRSTGIDFNQEAEFLPLPPDLNSALLASLGHDPFASPASTFGSVELTPAAYGHEHKSSNGSDYFSHQHAPYGILGPQVGASSDSMDEDEGFRPQGHGPHCKSIPQLSVRHNGGTTSELWASCPDCGACTKVQSDKPANLCYSP